MQGKGVERIENRGERGKIREKKEEMYGARNREGKIENVKEGEM